MARLKKLDLKTTPIELPKSRSLDEPLNEVPADILEEILPADLIQDVLSLSIMSRYTGLTA